MYKLAIETKKRMKQKGMHILKVIYYIEGYPKSHSLYVDVNYSSPGLKLTIIFKEVAIDHLSLEGS